MSSPRGAVLKFLTILRRKSSPACRILPFARLFMRGKSVRKGTRRPLNGIFMLSAALRVPAAAQDLAHQLIYRLWTTSRQPGYRCHFYMTVQQRRMVLTRGQEATATMLPPCLTACSSRSLMGGAYHWQMAPLSRVKFSVSVPRGRRYCANTCGLRSVKGSSRASGCSTRPRIHRSPRP